ncbi:hypothetical protein PR048_000823 [Dryococelus australis]|uniref:Uncharacterized protein n=1 Tax=Dryococelus australis TaxID=614101 RepID=A0ABQ9IFN8_9NEOP|nr:hypothetical protein PR048_000823 [Dryococelus australis]
MRVIEVSMEQRRNERAGKQEIPDGIVWHDSHMRKSGVTRPGIEPGSQRWEASMLTAQPPWPLIRFMLVQKRTTAVGMSKFFGPPLEHLVWSASWRDTPRAGLYSRHHALVLDPADEIPALTTITPVSLGCTVVTGSCCVHRECTALSKHQLTLQHFTTQLVPTQVSCAVIGNRPRPPHYLERCARGLLFPPFWESRKCRQRRDLLASQTSSHLLEFPIRLATTQECSGDTAWRLSPPRRITRVGEDSRWWPKTYIYCRNRAAGVFDGSRLAECARAKLSKDDDWRLRDDDE